MLTGGLFQALFFYSHARGTLVEMDLLSYEVTQKQRRGNDHSNDFSNG